MFVIEALDEPQMGLKLPEMKSFHLILRQD